MEYDHAFGTEIPHYTIAICDDCVCVDVGQEMGWGFEEAVYQARIYPKGKDAWIRVIGENIPFMRIDKITGEHTVCLPTQQIFI